jgi:ABC-type transport system involved in multi-copper enzyme maturation permease subunit
MGLVDILPPLADSVGLPAFEGIVFALSLLSLTVAIASTRKARKAAAEVPQVKSISRSGSLFRTNFRRAIGFGRIYLILGIVIPLFIGQGIGVNVPTNASVPPIVSEIFPLMLPVFASMGGVGALMVFVSDKSKGVYEYLIAYGVSTYDIFWSTVLATLGLVSVVLLVSFGGTAAILFATGGSMPATEIELLLIYSIPLSYAAAAFMSMSGMVWSFLTTRIAGVNSPVGLAPILGIAPVLVVLLLSSAVGPEAFTLLTAGATMVLVVAMVSMMVVANKKMVRERLLSEA